VVHEAWKSGGWGRSGLARAEKAFKYLKAPSSGSGPFTSLSRASLPLEKMFLPDEEKIAKAVRTVLAD